MKLALVYHKVHPRSDFGLSTVTPDTFARHLNYLVESGFEFTTLSQLQSSSAPKSCALVFDDAYNGILQYALPIMESFKCTGTMAVITDYVGKKNTWDVPLGPRSVHCDWPELTALSKQGWEMASHSCTHRALIRLRKRELDHECGVSKRILEDKLGAGVYHFVYPFGSRNRRTDESVRKAGYHGMSGFFAFSEPEWIVRRPVYRCDGVDAIRRKVNGHRIETVKESFIQFWSRASVFCQPIWI